MSITTNLFRLARSNLRLLRLTRCVTQQPTLVKLIERYSDNVNKSPKRCFCSVFSKSPEYSDVAQMDLVKFEQVCGTAIESMTEYFEEIIDADPTLKNSDVSYSDGVLTVKLGTPHGTYVINRQTPNRQIWLSSPTSGPKRYDYIDGKWIYKHDGVSLYELLQTELQQIFSIKIDFLKLS